MQKNAIYPLINFPKSCQKNAIPFVCSFVCYLKCNIDSFVHLFVTDGGFAFVCLLVQYPFLAKAGG